MPLKNWHHWKRINKRGPSLLSKCVKNSCSKSLKARIYRIYSAIGWPSIAWSACESMYTCKHFIHFLALVPACSGSAHLHLPWLKSSFNVINVIKVKLLISVNLKQIIFLCSCPACRDWVVAPAWLAPTHVCTAALFLKIHCSQMTTCASM